MKFSVFTDLHHHPGRYMGGTFEDLAFIEQRALANHCEFVIHAGDFCHRPKTQGDFIRRYRDFALPTYHVVGNHDFDHATHREALAAYGLERGYYFFDCRGYRFVALDTSYYYHQGAYFPYSEMDYAQYPQGRETLPPCQLEWLEQTVGESPYPCVVISHAGLDRHADGLKNQKEVRDIFSRANEKKRYSVILCINGHHHTDHVRILDGVCYLDLNSASFFPLDCPHSFYPKELTDQFSVVQHTLVYQDPIHAIVSLEGTKITVEGMDSSFLYGVKIEDTSNSPWDGMGRLCEPKIRSFSLSL